MILMSANQNSISPNSLTVSKFDPSNAKTKSAVNSIDQGEAGRVSPGPIGPKTQKSK